MFDTLKSFITHRVTTHALSLVGGYALALLLQYTFDLRLGGGYNHQTPALIRQWQWQFSANFQPRQDTPVIDLFGNDKKKDGEK